MKRPVLPIYYYLDHFTEMLTFVSDTYAPILTEEHLGFIARFETLSRDAKCLLIRMINRQRAVFDISAFKYAEVSNIEIALDDLIAGGLVRELEERDYAALLNGLPKAALLSGAKAAGATGVRTSWPKLKMVEYFLTSISFATAAEHCDADRYFALANAKPFEFLLYLYFGKTEDNLKNFALRDLGILRTNKASTFSARFTDGDEARACFHYSQLIDQLDSPSPVIFNQAVVGILGGPKDGGDYAAELRSRAACKVGKYFEKKGENALAQQLYRTGSSPKCNERLVRLLYATGDKDGADILLRRMIEDPASDDEFDFATDFHARKFGGRRVGVCTELLRAGRTIVVDETYRGNPEAGVAGVLRRDGWQVFYAENTLWHSLFGLLFWEELFESGQLHSTFDWVPHCLKDHSFGRLFARQIDTKLTTVRLGQGLPLLLRTLAARWGRPNGVFVWDHVEVEALRALLTGTDPNAIAVILGSMCKDYKATRDGFPDLMIARDGKATFIEVKADGDVIRRNQLTRLRQMREAGIPAEIGRVKYRFDPEQDYIVVDIETTGGWAASDRVTEIGAVKIRNHEVIDEYQSLINPQRSIPANITRLTGITNAMVRDAPVFAEIATEFIKFMGDGIFVAHNVNFDYGFISREFERLERRFRFPKVCTCAGMRRRYPGQKSYSLGNLCEVYGIDLTERHRALCDARAAGHLLNLINQVRDETERGAAGGAPPGPPGTERDMTNRPGTSQFSAVASADVTRQKLPYHFRQQS